MILIQLNFVKDLLVIHFSSGSAVYPCVRKIKDALYNHYAENISLPVTLLNERDFESYTNILYREILLNNNRTVLDSKNHSLTLFSSYLLLHLDIPVQTNLY
jgi:hypothetical protein